MLPRCHRKLYENNPLCFFLLYYIQGIPYSLQTRYLPLIFMDSGMARLYISLYKLAIVPWALKIIWAPMPAVRGNAKRTWLITSLACLVVLCLILSRYPPWHASCFTTTLILYNLAASLLDVALNSLVDEVSEAKRVTYSDRMQLAGNYAGALTVGTLAWITELIKWQQLFVGLAVLYFMGFIISAVMLPRWETPRTREISSSGRPETGTRRSPSQDLYPSPDNAPECYYWYTNKFTKAYTSKILNFDGSWWLLTSLAVYKIGEQGVMNVFPLYLLDEGHDISSVGFWTALFAQLMSVTGSVCGLNFNTRTYLRAVEMHLSIRAVLICAMWFAMMKWHTFPYATYVCSLISFAAIFFISASMTSCVFQMVLRVSKRAPRENRKDLFDLLMAADMLGKVLFTVILTCSLQLTGFQYVGVFGTFVAASVLLVPLLYEAPASVDV